MEWKPDGSKKQRRRLCSHTQGLQRADLLFFPGPAASILSLHTSQTEEPEDSPSPANSCLCIFSIRIPGFSLANSSRLVTDSTPWFKVSCIDTVLGRHSVTKYPAIIYGIFIKAFPLCVCVCRTDNGLEQGSSAVLQRRSCRRHRHRGCVFFQNFRTS